MRIVPFLIILDVLLPFSGCDTNQKTPPALPSDAPASQPKNRSGVEVHTPNVDVKSDKNGTRVRTPGLDVDVQKKQP